MQTHIFHHYQVHFLSAPSKCNYCPLKHCIQCYIFLQHNQIVTSSDLLSLSASASVLELSEDYEMYIKECDFSVKYNETQ
jgi:hypothetical protein